MESVPNVFEYSLFNKVLDEIARDYAVWKAVLNAALGVPQTRHRAIVMAYRNDLGVAPSAPASTHLGTRLVYDYTSGTMVNPASKSGARVLGLYPELGKADDNTDLGQGLDVQMHELLGVLAFVTHPRAAWAARAAPTATDQGRQLPTVSG